MKKTIFTLTAFLALTGIVNVQTAETKSSIKTIKLGKFEIIALQDAAFDFEANLFTTGDASVIKKLMPSGKAPGSSNVYVIKTPEHKILVDSGCGTSDEFKGSALENMKKAGINADDIDMVLITHAHFDHVGGLINKETAVFSKATLVLTKAEFDSVSDAAIKKLPEEIKKYYIPAHIAMKAYKGRIKTIKSGDTIIPGITSVDMAGHTAGSSGYMAESEGEKLFFAGDILHIESVQFTHPDYSLVYDGDPIKAAKIRSNTLKTLSENKIKSAGCHITFPGIFLAKNAKEGFSFSLVK